jgi:hypothetical protein
MFQMLIVVSQLALAMERVGGMAVRERMILEWPVMERMYWPVDKFHTRIVLS